MEEMNRMLLVIDPQVDFISGTLPVGGAREAMARLAAYVRAHEGDYAVKVITADRHPFDHCSFAAECGEWPRHCVHDTVGAAVDPELFEALYTTSGPTFVLHKGEDRDREEYSIFASAAGRRALTELVAAHRIGRVDICGLAGDVCVLQSLTDGLAALPQVSWRVLTRFAPSIDGGTALRNFISQHNLLCDR